VTCARRYTADTRRVCRSASHSNDRPLVTSTTRARLALSFSTLACGLALGGTASAATPRHLYGLAQVSSAKMLVPFDVAASGELTERQGQAVTVPLAAQTIVVGRNGRTVYVGSTQGYDNQERTIPGTIKVFAVADSGALTLLQTVTAPPRQMAMSPDGTRLFEWDDYGLVVSFPVAADGSLGAARANPSVTGSARAVSVSPDGSTLYVATYPQQLEQYAIGSDGALTALVPSVLGIFGCRADFLGITPDGSQLDAICYNQGITLSLAPAGGLAFNGALFSTWGGSANAEDVRGRALYKAISPNALEHLQRRPDGTLVDFPTPLIFTVPSVTGIAADPAGATLAVATNDWTIMTYAIAPDGSLSATASASTPTTLSSLTKLTYGPDQPPVAAISATPTGTSVAFDAGASAAVNGSIARYDWTFGDGTVLADGGRATSHRYAAPGAYVATVTLTDSAGCSVASVFTGTGSVCAGSAAAAASMTVQVVSEPVVPPVPPLSPPVSPVSPPAAEGPADLAPSPVVVRPLDAPTTPAVPEPLVVPCSLTGTPTSRGARVRVSWTPAPGAPASKRYLIAWSSLHSAQGPSDPNMRHIWTTDTELVMAGGRPGTTLHFAVYAYGSDGRLVKAGKTTIRVPR
jgi:PKD repeat protein